MTECDNVSACHTLTTINDSDALRVLCSTCKHSYVIRKHPVKDVPENRQYSKIFRKEVLQGKDNLFYKYYSQYLQT
jgi:hypothetical protein